ncbi:hypothetical protein LY76DRAFT_238930 [Colletotrichum caudatum]|nr:hypothetical protein LY76DRAFT_238930 [Colletotrichum caudatum]
MVPVTTDRKPSSYGSDQASSQTVYTRIRCHDRGCRPARCSPASCQTHAIDAPSTCAGGRRCRVETNSFPRCPLFCNRTSTIPQTIPNCAIAQRFVGRLVDIPGDWGRLGWLGSSLRRCEINRVQHAIPPPAQSLRSVTTHIPPPLSPPRIMSKKRAENTRELGTATGEQASDHGLCRLLLSRDVFISKGLASTPGTEGVAWDAATSRRRLRRD